MPREINFGLRWTIFDRAQIEEFLVLARAHGLHPVEFLFLAPHVQHEYSFFRGGTGPPEARRPRWIGSPDWPAPSRFFELMRSVKAPLVLTLHELLDGEKLSWNSRHARFSFLNRLNRYANRLTFGPADRVITHSRERRERLISMGVLAAAGLVAPGRQRTMRTPSGRTSRSRSRGSSPGGSSSSTSRSGTTRGSVQASR